MITEAELRDKLRAAVAQEPALGYDPGTLVTRARRNERRRRAVLASGVAAVLVVGLVFTLTTLLAGRPSTPEVEVAVGAASPVTARFEMRPVLPDWSCQLVAGPGSEQSAAAPSAVPPPGGSSTLPPGAVVARSSDGADCYVLGPTLPVIDEGTTVAVQQNAQSEVGEYLLDLRLSARGADVWGNYTQAHVREAVAFVRGSTVLAAPTIQAPIDGDTQITGRWDKAAAEELWRQLTGH